MKILYFGQGHGTSMHRANALIRMGHEVLVFDLNTLLFSMTLTNRYLAYFHYKSGYRFLQPSLCNWLQGIDVNNPDLIWIDGGELFGAKAVQILKQHNIPVVLFNHDDPTGSRDGQRFASCRSALPYYDVITAVREDSDAELKLICKGKVLRIWMSYDEIEHQALPHEQLADGYQSDVCFIGTWMRQENRDLFLLDLQSRGLNIAIWGDRWQKSAYWPQLKNHWRGSSLSGQDYVSAIQGAKICLGLLSKGNRDLHTTRSMEIPYAGGLLCAERTAEHLELYRENEEAVFWSDAQECAEKCHDLLAHPEKRERIRLAGMKRVLENKVGNEDICQQIITAAFQ